MSEKSTRTGAMKFWCVVFISGVFYFIYWSKFNAEILYYSLLIVIFIFYEVMMAVKREDKNDKFREVCFQWRHLSVIWIIYVIIVYYINPLFDEKM